VKEGIVAKKPTRIRIEEDVLPVEWEVRLGRLAEGYARAADYGQGRIRMGRGNARRWQRTHLMHEVVHHLWKKAALSDVLSTKTEELVIESLIPWLVLMMRQNPELVEFIMEEDDG
jgi:hypothetical protein